MTQWRKLPITRKPQSRVTYETSGKSILVSRRQAAGDSLLCRDVTGLSPRQRRLFVGSGTGRERLRPSLFDMGEKAGRTVMRRKAYKHHYGHAGGDRRLQEIAPGQVPARRGGEEFAVPLPETDPQGAPEVAEQSRNRVAGSTLPHAAFRTALIAAVSSVSFVLNGSKSAGIRRSLERFHRARTAKPAWRKSLAPSARVNRFKHS
ncbi:diguanylate cyclase domain-containing protein [Methylocaldum gracile subsp. desertum]|uniref:diguanylate cyclase domain-containing protein n=1 Tax=Methylocaldum sp. GT1BW TaxID=3438964 RepID=UPI003DA1A4CC